MRRRLFEFIVVLMIISFSKWLFLFFQYTYFQFVIWKQNAFILRIWIYFFLFLSSDRKWRLNRMHRSKPKKHQSMRKREQMWRSSQHCGKKRTVDVTSPRIQSTRICVSHTNSKFNAQFSHWKVSCVTFCCGFNLIGSYQFKFLWIEHFFFVVKYIFCAK